MASKKRPKPDPAGLFAHDRGFDSVAVAGADEAGRGCLAGPIVAAGVLLDRKCLENLGGGRLSALNDSKKMTEKAREELFPIILEVATKVCIVARSSGHIDRNGLHVTNIDCLSRSLVGLRPGEAVCLVDGFALPDCEVDHQKLIKGDSKSAAVAAASVIAKVTRDRYMKRIGEQMPGYGFEGHKGYASSDHRDAIKALGPSPIHRMSFASDAYL